MCVTLNPARIQGTRTAVYCLSAGTRVCFYQNQSDTIGSDPNCMFLNFPGSNLSLVRGPESTHSLMDDMTWSLPELVPNPRMRGASSLGGSKGITIEEYGDYTNVLAQEPGDILDALDEVREDRRPARTAFLDEMVNFYMSLFSEDSFVLACSSGMVKPHHPIAVMYEPRNPSLLSVPGLDGHDGKLPVPGAPVHRDFHVAFAVEGIELSHQVLYGDPIANKLWAPRSVAGFRDNRREGPNGDYVVSVANVTRGLTGHKLAATLR